MVAVIGYLGAGFEMLIIRPRKLFVMAGINSLEKLDNTQFKDNRYM